MIWVFVAICWYPKQLPADMACAVLAFVVFHIEAKKVVLNKNIKKILVVVVPMCWLLMATVLEIRYCDSNPDVFSRFFNY